jgi:hypothetical protein
LDRAWVEGEGDGGESERGDMIKMVYLSSEWQISGKKGQDILEGGWGSARTLADKPGHIPWPPDMHRSARDPRHGRSALQL